MNYDSLERELNSTLDMNEVKEIVKSKFQEVFDVQLV